MRLSGRDAARFLAKPDPARAGLLIFGADSMRVALKRQEAIAALIGPEGEAEMRLTRIPAADLRKDPALVADAIKAKGFFSGPRVAFVEDAADGLADLLRGALSDWRPGDATLIVTAGNLTAKSMLRKAFEDNGNAVAIGIYDDPPTKEEIEADLARAGLKAVDPAAMTDLVALSRALDPGDFRQTVEKIGLYKWHDPKPLTPTEVALCAPATIEAEVDDALNLVAEGQRDGFGAIMRRLEGQGVNPVTLCIGAERHFRALHAAASDPGGVASGLARMRPPVFGPRRDRMARQAQIWGVPALEKALAHLIETDLTLRSTSRAPAMALIERALMRLVEMPRGR